MKTRDLSDEQEHFISEALKGKNILVEAVIGSGKTTSIQELVNRLPQNKKVLYLTYNKLLKVDAKNKIKNHNALVQNYHGFAYYMVVRNHITPTGGVENILGDFIRFRPRMPRYDVLIIDEYQDITSQIAEVLNIIKQKCPGIQIIAVGDMAQKIYDSTALNVSSFISDFLDEHEVLSFTKCFRLSKDYAAKLGDIWGKKITGVNSDCVIKELGFSDTVKLLAERDPSDVMVLGARDSGKRSGLQNLLEKKYPKKYNKKTVWSDIRETGDSANVKPNDDAAVFATFDKSKGMERNTCVVCDFDESYWTVRAGKASTRYEILRNIFLVAASRGKKEIIFLTDGKNPLIPDAVLKKPFKTVTDYSTADLNINTMFDFTYDEDARECFDCLETEEVPRDDHSMIQIAEADCLIDLSPCVAEYAKSAYFEDYDIDTSIEYYLNKAKDSSKYRMMWEGYNDVKGIKHQSLKKKILFLTMIQTGQDRYMNANFKVSSKDKALLIERLSTLFDGDEDIQRDTTIDLINGDTHVLANGIADVVKEGAVYEIEYTDSIRHSQYLKTACYMTAKKRCKGGYVFNVKDNTLVKVTIKDPERFKNLVMKTITKRCVNKITDYKAFMMRS